MMLMRVMKNRLKSFGVVNDRAATDVDECNEEMDKVFGVEYDGAATHDDDSNEEIETVSGVVNDVREVLSRVEMIIDDALTHFSSQSSEESQETTDTADGDADTVVNSCQQSQVPQSLINMLSAGAGNLNMANDSEEAEVNCLMKNSQIKIEEGAKIEMEPSETDIGNKSKKTEINLERGPLNLTMEKDSKLTLSSRNAIGNDVSEKAKVDIASKGIDLVLKQKSEMVITEKVNIANSTKQAEVIIKTDHQKFECGEGVKVKLVSGTGGLNTALQQENQVPESQEKAVWGANAFRVVLLGNTKSGKSSTGNTIINRQMNGNTFFVGKGFKSSTHKCQTETNYTHSFRMTVTDTPGLWNTEHTFEEVFSEILESMDPGPHVILLVIRLGTKLTDEDIMSYLDLKWIFGDSIHKYIIVVFTGVDQICDNECESYEKMEREMKMILRDSPIPLSSLLPEVEYRYIAFNNKARDDVNNRQREELFKMIEHMVRANKGRHFELQIKHSSDRLRNFQITNYYCSCCGSYVPYHCTRLEVKRWYTKYWHDIPSRYIGRSCGIESNCQMRCDSNVPHDCTSKGIASINDQVILQSKGVESTKDQVILQSKGVESTKDQVILQSKGVESTKDQVILQSKGVESTKDQVILQSKGIASIKDQVILQSKGVESTKDQVILQSKGIASIKDQVILQSKGVESTKDQVILQSKGVESTKDQVILQSKGVESTKDQVILQSKGVESTKDQVILQSKVVERSRYQMTLQSKFKESINDQMTLQSKFKESINDPMTLQSKFKESINDQMTLQSKFKESIKDQMILERNKRYNDILQELNRSTKSKNDCHLS